MSIKNNTTTLQTILNTIANLPEAGEDLDKELSTQETLLLVQHEKIAELTEILAGKASGGSKEPILQNKTVTPTISTQTITADSGYDGLDVVTVNAMPTTVQATPSITVNTSGLITASTTQTAGYVSAGTKSATKQLTIQAAQTITPSTMDKTISSGRYLTGTQTIKGDANLVAENIKNGVSIFGITGSYEAGESGGSGEGIETCVLTLYTSGPIVGEVIVYYINGSSSVQNSSFSPNFKQTVEVTIMKNSIVFTAGSSIECSGDATRLDGYYGYNAFFISGDATLSST